MINREVGPRRGGVSGRFGRYERGEPCSIRPALVLIGLVLFGCDAGSKDAQDVPEQGGGESAHSDQSSTPGDEGSGSANAEQSSSAGATSTPTGAQGGETHADSSLDDDSTPVSGAPVSSAPADSSANDADDVTTVASGASDTDAGTAMGEASDAGGAVADQYDTLVNPYGIAPLVAVVNVHGVDPAEVSGVRVVVFGLGDAPDFERVYSPIDEESEAQLDTTDLSFPEPGYHVPVYGLYPDTDNTVSITLDLTSDEPVEIEASIATTLREAAEAAWVPDVRVNTAMPELMEPGWTVAEISIEPVPAPLVVLVDWTRTIAFDERGDIRWALLPQLPLGETFTLTRSTSGSFWTGSLNTIVEVNKLGRTLHSFELSDHTLHHEILQVGSDDPTHASPGESEHAGNLLVLASLNGADTVQDHILELEPQTGEVLNDWDMKALLDPSRTTYIDPEEWAPGSGDWLHANGVAYSNEDEAIIVSARHQGVAKFSREGTLSWLLAPHAGWLEPQAAKLLTAVDATGAAYDEAVQSGDEPAGDANEPEFGWPFGQHSPVLLSNGDLMLFDNGSSRQFGPICGGFSRVVIYRIDEAAMTVRQMGQFVLSVSESSCFVSNTHQLPTTGNVFIQPGSTSFDNSRNTSVIKEVAAEITGDGTVSFGTVVFDATLDLSWTPSGRTAYSYRGHRWAL